MRLLLIVGLLAIWPAVAQQPVVEDPIERQMLDIARDLRCAVCQNQPVAESNADLARDMRDIIREQLKAGKSREEIVQYFVDRYGDYVLMRPPTRGPGLWLWVAPLAVGGVVVLSALVYLKRRRRDALPPAPKLSADDRRRIEQARREAQ